ncbi:MAG: carbohydrate ABC transporter permease [Anaerolineales bacterium]|nr:carbohydrate ABC transporter permease [Anaerolineales bacterium]
MRQTKTPAVQKVAIWGVIIVVVFWVLFPFYWAFLNSIKKPADTFTNTYIPFLQFQPTLEHWQAELAIPEIQRAMMNSFIISVGAATLAVMLGVFAAYALARFQYRRVDSGRLTTWFLSELKLLDNVLSLVLLNATFVITFPVIILSQMFRELPRELEEAAFVDGASMFQAFLRVSLPLIMPGVVAVWIICMAFSWNEFLYALSLTSNQAIQMPVMIAGAEHTRGVQFWFVGVRVLLTILPPTILALLAQRYIIRGLTLGAVKG